MPEISPLKIGLIAVGIVGAGYILKKMLRKGDKIKEPVEEEGCSLE